MTANEVETIPKKKGTVNPGLKYESQITTLLAAALSQDDGVADYWIVSSPEGIDHFDDIVAVITDLAGNKHALFVQLKHSKKILRLLTAPSKTNPKFMDIPLYKYLESYNGIRNLKDGHLKQKLEGILLDNYFYCLFTNVEEVQPGLESANIASDNPIRYLDFTRSGRCSRWTVNVPKDVPEEYSSFFKQFYFLTGQPNTTDILNESNEALPGFTRAMTANFCELIDESLTFMKGNSDDKCLFLTKTVYLKKLANVLICHQIMANMIQGTTIVEQYFNVLDAIFAKFSVVKIKPEGIQDLVTCIYAYYEYKIQELYDNYFVWNECYQNCYRLSIHTKEALKRKGIHVMHLVELLLDMWERGEVPFVVNSENCSLFATQINILTAANCRFILITNSNEQVAAPPGTKLFETLYDLREDTILEEIMKIDISLQGRPHVSLNDLVGDDKNSLRDITGADLIRWIVSSRESRIIGRELRQLDNDYIARKFHTLKTINLKSNQIPKLNSEKEMVYAMNSGLTVIANDPGMGKSTVLNCLALHCNPKNYVILYNLADCLQDLTSDQGPIYDDPIGYFFNKSESNDNDTLAGVIYKQHRANGRLTIIIDSFDEILPIYNKKVVAIIQEILKTQTRVFLTTRTQASELLEEVFKNAEQIQLTALEMSDIEWYCEQHGVSNDSLKTLPTDFLAVPMHLNMLTQAYKRLDYSTIRITNLYKEFISRKIQDFCFKKKVADQNTAHNLEIEEVVLNRHYKLALVHIFGKQSIEDLKIISSGEWDKIVQDFNEYKSPVGLVSFVSTAAHIRFVHKTYAEYLAARWICEHSKDSSARNLYKKVVEETEFEQVYKLLDEICCETAGGIFTAISNGVLENVSFREDSPAHEDTFERSPIHYAASNCHNSGGQQNITKKYKIFENLLSLMPKSIQSKDEVLDWTPFDFLVGKQNFDPPIADIKYFKYAMMSKCTKITYELLMAYTIKNEDFAEIVEIALDNNFIWVALMLLEKRDAKHGDLNKFNWGSKSDHKILILLLCLRKNMKEWVVENKITSGDSYSNKLLQDKIQFFHKEIGGVSKQNFASLLNLACALGNVKSVELLLLNNEINISSLDPSVQYNLHYACIKGQVEIVNILLENKADPNLPDSDGWTSLHRACNDGKSEIVQLLLNHKADPNLPDFTGGTSLHHACYGGKSEIVELLLNHKADPNLPDSDKQTSLHRACYGGKSEIVQLLLNHKADPNLPDSDGWTSLHRACYRGKSEIVQLLLNHKGDPNLPNSNKCASLHLACYHGKSEIVQLLLNHKADPNLRNSYEGTSLHHACRNGHTEIVQLLLNHKADPNLPNCYKWTSLHHAYNVRDKEIVK